jgi:hypothetical protein
MKISVASGAWTLRKTRYYVEEGDYDEEMVNR